MTKVCETCKEIKEFREFSKLSTSETGYHKSCKPCGKKYYLKNQTKYRNYKKSRRDVLRSYTYLKRYGITKNQYDEMFESQEGKCFICQRHQSEFKKRLYVDHNHITKKVRGLLCDRCNKALGMFQSDTSVSILERAVEYIKRS